MTKQSSDHGIALDEKSQEQPTDKRRAQNDNKTGSGHMPPQPKKETADKSLEETKEKSGF